MHTKVRFGKAASRVYWAVMIGIVLVLSLPAAAQADGPWPDEPVCNREWLRDQWVLICMPPVPPTYEPWNGTLVVYAHGYVAPHMGLALPAEELGRIELPEGARAVDFLLAQGFAFATTSYSGNGWAVNAAEKDLNELVRHFKTKVLPNAGLLEKVLIIGASEGGLITTLMVEKYPGIYDGGLAMCGPIGGMPAQVEYLADFRVVFDYFFPDVFPAFGVADVPEHAYLGWPEYGLAIPAAMQSEPDLALQVLSAVGALHEPIAPSIYVSATVQAMYYSVVGTFDMIATAGGMPYDNRDTYYGPVIDPGPDGVERVRGDGRAMAFVRRAYEPTGELERPLVTIHNVNDYAVPYWHEGMYAARAASSGFWVQYPVPGVHPPLAHSDGHCAFTGEEVQGAFGLLVGLLGP
jgi:pimeloyl-ACP methyl ester carboxylesterase